MIGTGYPGDSDPKDEHPVCGECAEDLSQDFWGEWFCEDCEARKLNADLNTKNTN